MISIKHKKRLYIFGALLVFSGSAFFVAPKSTFAKEWNIFISNAHISGDTANEDFVEIRNNENCALDLSDWKLRKRTASGTESSIKVFDGDRVILPPEESFLWANSQNGFSKTRHAHQESSATLTENNSLALLDANNTLIDSISWGIVSNPFQIDGFIVPNPETNESITRTSKTETPLLKITPLPNGKSFDTDLFDVCGASKDRADTSSVILSEILANPTEDESDNEFIELENRSEKSIDISGWKLRDASKTGKYTFPEESSIKPNSFLTLFRTDFVFALNNSNETVTLEDAKNAVADSVSWETAHENISLARDKAKWRNTKFLTPDAKNRFGNDPSAKTTVPKNGFVNIPLKFSSRIIDKDRETTKVTWNFGDGRKSYKKETSHTFKKKGRYTVKLTFTDGISDQTKTFRINIKKYVAPKVRITSLVPNPDGKDEGKEYFLITNHSKKTVDLKGWSIATKSSRKTKNFVNHTITKNFILKPGESKKITKKYASFTIGNKKMYIEFRDPQGKTIQKFRYKFETNAPENAEYFKAPGERWQWKNISALDTKQIPM